MTSHIPIQFHHSTLEHGFFIQGGDNEHDHDQDANDINKNISKKTNIYWECVTCQALCCVSHGLYYFTLTSMRTNTVPVLQMRKLGFRGALQLTQDHTARYYWSQESHPGSLTSETVLLATIPGPSLLYIEDFASPWPGCLEPQRRRAGHPFPGSSNLGVRNLESIPNGFDLLYGSISISKMGQKNLS